MNPVLFNLNLVLHGWFNLILKAIWQGGLGLAGVWLIIKLWPAIHPALKCWLWRLAFLKLIIILVWTIPVYLPILSPTPVIAGKILNTVSNPIQNIHRIQLGTTTALMNNLTLHDTTPSNSPFQLVRYFPILLLLISWLYGIIWYGRRLWKEWQKRQQLITGTALLKEPEIIQYNQDLCAQMGIKHAPTLMTVRTDIGSPLLLGNFHPKILFSEKNLENYQICELKLMLAHELAHLKRHDLFWNWIPELGQLLFFFHPLLWLTRSNLHQAQESCCDYLAIQYSNAANSEYGALLLKTATNISTFTDQWQIAFYQPKPKRILKERLLALKGLGKHSTHTSYMMGMIIVVVGLLTVIPWSFTVRATGINPEPSYISTTNQDRQIRKQQILHVWGAEINRYQKTLDNIDDWNSKIKDQLNFLIYNKVKSESIKKYQTELANNRVWGIEANVMLGRIYYLQGDYRKAIDYLKKVPAYDLRWGAWARLTLGWCYDALGDRKAALSHYQEIYWRNLFGLVQESIATAASFGREAPHHPTKMVKINPDVRDEKIPTVGWKAITNFKQDLATNAFDGDPLTQWHTDTPQIPGMYYQLDLGQVRLVDRVVLNDDAGGTTIYVSDYPRKYRIEISTDAKKWRTVISEMGNLNYYAGCYFKPTHARYIKITQLGFRNPENWAIYELEVYSPK